MATLNKKNNTLAKALTELSNPAPIDVDPEEFGETFRTYDFDQNDSGEENEKLDSSSLGRDHYVQVGKSSLRNLQFVLDDPNDEESENGDLDEIGSSDAAGDLSNDEDDVGNSEFDRESDMPLNKDPSVLDELRKIEEDERHLLKKISRSAKEDITKGRHVKTQINLWDTFLDTRIHLQKAVSIANKLPQPNMYSHYLTTETESVIKETQDELRGLVDSLVDLRKDLYRENEIVEINENVANSRKRHQEDDDYAEYLWKDIQEMHNMFLPHRTQIIEKWNNKVQIASGIPLNKKFKAINQSANVQIEQALGDRERLVKRTQLKRNSDKILGKDEQKLQDNDDSKKHDEQLFNYDLEIFDDTDFYQQLLRELIESRMIDTDDPVAFTMRWAALKQTKQKKKKVDTKSSKGRRMRYHVQEKLQNFMVPIPAGTWHDDMIDELYTSLLGKNFNDGVDVNDNEGVQLEREHNDSNIESGLDGLRIFG
ncbi:10112_t:CDS:10 [Acaulospora morrowiae]|uniref:Protein BFR2 n=1 Tax=Acaulospora morrowiae TaxID=94023 RepID=A0A9N9B910_9GLOM|nr:10112_t:CDS:10 [Acaulospora morrowiae]